MTPGIPSVIDALTHVLPETAAVSDGVLVIGGCDVRALTSEFGTPLIVLDRSTFESKARLYAASIGATDQVVYAGKAFLCMSMCQLVERMGLGLDVCSGGELATAIAAGFPAERIEFHGNNKSSTELEAARDAGVGRIVIDSLDEMDRIREAGLRTKTLIRVTPGIEADTHRFIQTGQADSKFGFTLMDDVALDAIERALGIPGCPLVGVHAHIGSQIADLESFDHLASRLAELLARAEERFGFRPTELNLGGGFAIAYVAEERPPRPEEVVSRIKASVDRAFTQREIEVPRLFIEPGRSLIGPAGVSIYSVGTVKHVPSQDGGSERRTFVSVDGGMGDNIRPALYGARYCAILASRSSQRNSRTASVVGKYCESGDFLIEQVDLPEDVGPGDLLAVPATGAYTYSMAGNYNRNPRPAVVLVEEGTSRVMIERETHDDLLRHDRTLNAGI